MLREDRYTPDIDCEPPAEQEPEPVPAPQATARVWWKTWPMMNCQCLQGDSGTTIHDETQQPLIAEASVLIMQGFYPITSRAESRINSLGKIRAINPDLIVLPHVMAQETWKEPFSPPYNSELEVAGTLIRDPIEGNPNWFVHRVGKPGDDGRVEAEWNPDEYWNCNMAALVSGLNKLGETYAQGFWRTEQRLIDAPVNGSTGVPSSDPKYSLTAVIDGYMLDNTNQRPPTMYQNNGTTSVSDFDFSGDGTVDNPKDFTKAKPTAGGRQWAEGALHFKSAMEAHCPRNYVICPNAARWAGDYTDGQGMPPLPLSEAPFYRVWELALLEHMNLKLGISRSGGVFRYEGWGSVQNFCRAYSICDAFIREDSRNTRSGGKGACLIHASCFKRTPTQADYTYARFITAMCMMLERAAPCVQMDAAQALALDEYLLDFGDPSGPRSMGSLNDSPGATPTFNVRAPDYASGAAQFHISKYEKLWVVARTDSPPVGTYPSSAAAVRCPLTAPAGKKLRHFDAATYVNPKTHRATRNQTPALNNGQPATGVDLRPFEAAFLELVDDDGSQPEPPDCRSFVRIAREGGKIVRLVIDVAALRRADRDE